MSYKYFLTKRLAAIAYIEPMYFKGLSQFRAERIDILTRLIRCYILLNKDVDIFPHILI
jgi:hypothetical protein